MEKQSNADVTKLSRKELLEHFERERQDIIQDYEDKAKQTTPAVAEEPFVDYMQNWLNTAKSSIQPTTLQSYSRMVNGRIEQHFRPKGIKLGELQPLHIHEFYQGILAEGKTTNTVIHYHAVIRRALNQAFKLGIIPSNPADRVDRPKKNKFTAGYYSRDEVDTLLEATSDDPLNIAIYIGVYYGLRRSDEYVKQKTKFLTLTRVVG